MLGLGIFQALSKATLVSRFLWISTLAKPDTLLNIVVALLMASAMALAPGGVAEPSMLAMIAISIAIAIASLAALPSAVGIYWAASNAASIVQALALRAILSRRPALPNPPNPV